MSNWFAGLGQAMTGMDAARYGLSVVSQNIANADTEGYTRQTAQQAAVVVPPASGLYTTRTNLPDLGGTTVVATTRSDDPVLDARMRYEHSRGSAADTTASSLSALEGVVGEPSDTGLSAQLGAYWSAWGTVANSPDSTPARTVLLKSAEAVTSTLHSLSDSFAGLASSTSADLSADVTQVNSAAQQLAKLNGDIAIASALHNNANDLLDKRDQLLDSLSKLTGAVASIGANGAATVTVGGQTLVSGVTATAMTVNSSNQISVGGNAVTLSGGSAAARVELLTTTLPGYQAQLDSVANTLAAQGNAFQASGYDRAGNAGTPMFSGTGAAGLTVALTDPAGVAASSSPGGNLDGSNALRASQAGKSTSGADSVFANLVGALGSASSLATQQQSTQAAVVTNVDALHASTNGVNYDEEVSNMLTYQHAFSASSRVLTTIDQMLDTLINHTGLSGQSMTLRVTVGSIAYTGLQAIRSTSENLADLQARLTSGKQILNPSDNPTGTVRAMNLRSEMARNDQYATNANDALAWLSTADTAYSQVVSVLQQARTLVVQGLNTGANDASASAAIAQQVDSLRSSLISLANTSYNGRPVFGGTTAGGAAYDSSGAYVGDAGSVSRMIAPDTTVSVSGQGPTVFGSGSSDVFAMLGSIAATLRTAPGTLSGSLANLDGAISRVSDAQAVQGATYQQVERAQTAQTSAATSLTTQLSSIMDVDTAQMAIEVTTANTAYQAALQTTASIKQLSLLDFLR